LRGVSRPDRRTAQLAIEATVDRISFELHPLAKQAKDMGSAAQLLALCLIGLVWAVILIP